MKKVSWITNCEICNVGLCKRIDGLKDEGKTIREAARIMETESEGMWEAEKIRARYKYYKGGRKPPKIETIPDPTTHHTDNIDVTHPQVDPTAVIVTDPAQGKKHTPFLHQQRFHPRKLYPKHFVRIAKKMFERIPDDDPLKKGALSSLAMWIQQNYPDEPIIKRLTARQKTLEREFWKEEVVAQQAASYAMGLDIVNQMRDDDEVSTTTCENIYGGEYGLEVTVTIRKIKYDDP